MGLLNFLPEDETKKQAARQGLLSLGAAMLQGRGNFGNVLGQGIAAGAQGYQGSLQDQQRAQLHNAQAERWKMENEQTRRSIAEPGEIARIIAGGQDSAPAATPGAPQSGVMPLSVLPVTGGQPAAQPSAATPSTAEYYRAIGDRLSAAGRVEKAKPYYDMAEKMKPKLKEQRALTRDGKRVMANVYDDGRTEELEGFAPDAEKLHFRDTGGSVDGLDAFTGNVVSTAAKTQSPDNRANNARMAAEQAANRAQSERHFNASQSTSMSRPFEVTGPDGAPVLVRQDKQGNIEPVAGYLPKGRVIKPLPSAVVKTVTEARDNALTMDRLNSSFKPEFGGKGVFGIGADMSMAVKGNVGADQEAVAFWKDYRKNAELVERHSMFGASLTPGEQASWRSADIAPGMSPEVIKTNLATRAKLTKRVAEASAEDMIDAGHNEGRVKAIAERGQPKAAKVGAYSDADKERRYQEWKASQGKK